MRRTLLPGCCLIAAALLVLGCGNKAAENGDGAITGDLTIFHAGSLSVPFREISALFTQKYPGVTIKAEAAGTRDSARKITDLGRTCDVFGAADYRAVENLLIPDHADFNIRFATNEMIILKGGSRGISRNPNIMILIIWMNTSIVWSCAMIIIPIKTNLNTIIHTHIIHSIRFRIHTQI